MKYATRLFVVLIFLAGSVGLVYYSIENQRLAADVSQLEAELGKMSITDIDRVHIVEIAVPDVPPEVAPHIKRVWQFRCYLPPGYDFMKTSGSGRVAEDGLYLAGGFGSGWGSPQTTAIHSLMTVCLQEKAGRLQAFYTIGGSSGTTSFHKFKPGRLSALVAQKLASSKQGSRSFSQETILPLLKVYDPDTAEESEVAGKALVTYAGGLFIICPKSREALLDQLRNGEIPPDFDPSCIAEAVIDE